METNIDIEQANDEDPPVGGVREPKRPILPSLSGSDAIEIEREQEFDLCICSNK